MHGGEVDSVEGPVSGAVEDVSLARDEGVVLEESVDVEEGTVKTTTSSSSSTNADHAGPSSLWDEDQQWILVFDRLLNSSARGGGARSRPEQTDGPNADMTSATRSPFVRSGSLRVSGRRLMRPPHCVSPALPPSTERSSVAGAVDEAMFIAAFEDVARVDLQGARDLEEKLGQIGQTLANSSADWDRRVDSLKQLRSLLMCGATSYEELPGHLRQMIPALQLSVRDLRSQVVREACISVAYVCQQLRLRADNFSLAMAPSLLDLVPNSAKVISSSGLVCMRFMVQHCAFWRLVGCIAAPLVSPSVSSRSRDIRRASCELLEQLLTSWPAATLQKQLGVLEEAVRRGIGDADPEARASSRRAYWSFAANFPEQANTLLASLDHGHKKLLTHDSSSVDAPHNGARVSSRTGTLTRTDSVKRRYVVPDSGTPRRHETVVSSIAARSTSAVDLQAAQRARARAQYAAAQRSHAAYNDRSAGVATNSAHRTPMTPSNSVTSETTPTRARPSQSQPGSRSSSPSRRFYSGYRRPPPGNGRISNPPSRDSSPPSTPLGLRSVSGSATRNKQQSCFVRGSARASSFRSPLRPSCLPSPAHQVSSVTAAMSGISLRDRTESGYRSSTLTDACTEDVSAMITAMASEQWTERKHGLVSLHAYLLSDRSLSGSQLLLITEVFNKLLVDPHTKVFGIFLDTLQELVMQHHDDLTPWLYSLTCRLLNKLGADLLGSVVQKLNKTLDVVRSVFSRQAQLQCVCRLMLDPAQVQSTRVRTASLRHLRLLLEAMEPTELTKDSHLQLSIAKIIGWTSDQRSGDVRREARAVVIALFDLNTPQFTIMLSQLSKDHQDTATEIMRRHLRQRSSESVNSPAGVARQSSLGSIDSDQAADQQRKFSSEDLLCVDVRERDTVSQDSGISQLSLGSRSTDSTTGSRTPVQRAPGSSTDLSVVGPITEDPYKMVDFILSTLGDSSSSNEARKMALFNVRQLAKFGTDELWQKHLRPLLRLLLDVLRSDGCPSCRQAALAAVSDLASREDSADRLEPFAELLFLRVLGVCGGTGGGESCRAGEQCAAVLSRRLLPATVLRVLTPLIQTGESAVCQAAVKALSQLVSATQEPDVVAGWLIQLMPALLRAYDHSESCVRKAAVFCIVAVHQQVGAEALDKHLAVLSSTKLKLLNLYIRRAQQGAGTSCLATPSSKPTTPK